MKYAKANPNRMKTRLLRVVFMLLAFSLFTGVLSVPALTNPAYAAAVSGTSPATVIAIAQAEVGYLEKASNSNLYDKKANSGSGNWNKYAADIDKYYPDFYNGKKNIGGNCGWCDIFVDWCFIQAYGYDKALQLLCQPTKSCGAGPSYSMKYYKNVGQFGKTPKLGAQIFVNGASHTGLVVNYDNTYVYTIEGNWGNAVKNVKRKLTSSEITGYGYPGFTSDSETSYTDKEIDITGAVYPSGNYGSLTNFGLRGIVTTSGYLVSVEGSLYNLTTRGNDYYKKVSFSNTTTQSHDIQGPINDALIFGGLTGYYEYQIVATYVVNGETKSSILIDSFFTIGNFKLITALSLTETSKILEVTGSYQSNAVIEPSNASHTTLEWESADPSIATVSDSGIITAVAPGSTDIYCRTTDGTNLIATCHISIPGQCGDNLTWGYHNNTLTITGSGAMYWYDYAPWYNLRENIQHINISNEVTELGSYAFSECTAVQTIELPQNLTHVGTGTFASCTALESITIPASLTGINTEAFINCSGLTAISFPSTLQSIGWGAFSGCSSLTTVDIPDSVYDIQNESFRNCTGLQKVTIPGTVAVIGDDAFAGCYNVRIYCPYGSQAHTYAVSHGISYVLTSGSCGANASWSYGDGTLTISGSGAMTDWNTEADVPWNAFKDSITSIVINNGITTIGSFSFESMHYLNSVSLPGSLTEIHQFAFDSCDGLPEIQLNDGLQSIGHCAFDLCNSLTSIYLPTSVSFVHSTAFLRSGSLLSINAAADNPCYTSCDGVLFNKDMTELVCYPRGCAGDYTIPDGTTGIGWNAFANSRLSGITIPSSVTAIGNGAFCMCGSLTSVELPNGIEAIKSETFASCNNLTDIVIPASVTEIESYAFSYCTALSRVYYTGTGEQWSQIVFGTENDALTGAEIIAGYILPHDHELTAHEEIKVTCTEAGIQAYWSCDICGKLFSDDHAENEIESPVIISALGHAWGIPTYAWNEDNTEVTATRVCAHNADHEEHETVSVTSEVTLQPTCTEMGETTYTSAGFVNEAFSVQIRTLVNVDARHVPVTDEAMPATCEATGLTEGSHCAICGEVLAAQDVIPALGHAWGEASYTWNETNTAVTAARICAYDASHKQEETVGAARTVAVSPSETVQGEYWCVSDAFENDAFDIQERVGCTIPALGTINVLKLPAGLVEIEDEAFEGMAIQAVIIPDTCTAIGNRAFANNKNLIYAYIPASVTSIASDAFAECPNAIIEAAPGQPYTLLFDANGGSCSIAGKTCYVNNAIGALPKAVKEYHTFEGWYTAASGGSKASAATVFTADHPVTLYAHWTQKPLSGWVLESQVPSNATIEETSWSYRESAESASSSMSGWTADGEYWKQTGTGSAKYATFPDGFSTSHSIYTTLEKQPYEASETATSKREVSNTHAGYVYWHWAYNVAWSSSMSRPISAYKQMAAAIEGGSSYYYNYFFAFESETDCPSLGITDAYSIPAGLETWNCYSIIQSVTTSEQRSSGTSGVATSRFYRFETFTSTYTDYQKVYKYYRDVSNASTDPGDGSNISNKVKYVKYRMR